jgi:hypothetical protein
MNESFYVDQIKRLHSENERLHILIREEIEKSKAFKAKVRELEAKLCLGSQVRVTVNKNG